MLFSFPNHTNIFRRCTVDCRLYQVRASCPQSQVLRLISTCPRNTFRPLESLCHTDRFRVFSGSSSRLTLYWLEICSTEKIKGYIKYTHLTFFIYTFFYHFSVAEKHTLRDSTKTGFTVRFLIEVFLLLRRDLSG